jgi:hypothetical protein
VEYKSDIRRDGNDYLSKNAEQEVSVKLGLALSLTLPPFLSFCIASID